MRESMGKYGQKWPNMGNPNRNPQKQWESMGDKWKIMENNGNIWDIMGIYGINWDHQPKL